jgi:hypothetical protein
MGVLLTGWSNVRETYDNKLQRMAIPGKHGVIKEERQASQKRQKPTVSDPSGLL